MDLPAHVRTNNELYAPDDAGPTRWDWMPVEWAQRWAVEEIWTARLRA